MAFEQRDNSGSLWVNDRKLSFKPKDDALAADKSRAEMDDEIAF